jgi:hypothetical protein
MVRLGLPEFKLWVEFVIRLWLFELHLNQTRRPPTDRGHGKKGISHEALRNPSPRRCGRCYGRNRHAAIAIDPD